MENGYEHCPSGWKGFECEFVNELQIVPASNMSETLAAIGDIWTGLDPEYLFTMSFFGSALRTLMDRCEGAIARSEGISGIQESQDIPLLIPSNRNLFSIR